MKNKKAIKKKIMEDEDFIYCPRLGNSLEKLMDITDNSMGVSDDRICKVLLISKKELDTIYNNAISKLKNALLKGKDDQ